MIDATVLKPQNNTQVNAQSLSDKGITAESKAEKSIRIRGLTSLSAIRKEIVRVYSEARAAGAVAEKITFYRALTYILSAAAQVKKDESLEEIETRLKALEERECANH